MPACRVVLDTCATIDGILAFCRWYGIAALLHDPAKLSRRPKSDESCASNYEPRDISIAIRILFVRNTLTLLRYTRAVNLKNQYSYVVLIQSQLNASTISCWPSTIARTVALTLDGVFWTTFEAVRRLERGV